MGNGHLPLGFHPVNLQIPRLPYPHNKGKPQVQSLRKESLGGIPAVKQQQTASQTKFRQLLYIIDSFDDDCLKLTAVIKYQEKVQILSLVKCIPPRLL